MSVKFGSKTASNTGPVNTPSMQQDSDSILVLLGQNSIKNTDLIKEIVNKIDFQSIIASVQEIQKTVVSIQPFIEDTWANIGDMFDKLKEMQTSSLDTVVSGPEGTIRFIIECSDGQAYTAIREILDIASGEYDDKSFESIDELIDVFKYIEKISKETSKLDLSNINKATVKSMHNLYLVAEELKSISIVSSSMVKYILPITLFSDQLTKFPGILIDIIGTKQKDRGIARLYDRLTTSKLDMKVISDFVLDLSDILKSTIIIGSMASLSNKLFKHIVSAIKALNDVIDQINSVKIKSQKYNNVKNLKVIKDNITGIRDILVTAALLAPLSILAIPGILSMKLVFNVLEKTQTDNIQGVSKIVKDEKKIRDDNRSFMHMIIGSGLVLLGAAIFGGFIARHAGNIALFTLILSGFIILMSGVALLSKILLGLSKTSTKGSKRKQSILSKIFGNTNDDSYNSIFDDLSMLVASAALTLLIGSIFIGFVNIGNLLLFAGILITFTFLLSLAVFGAKQIMGSDGVAAFTGLGNIILISTIALGIGALFINAGLGLAALAFAGILVLTVAGIMIAVGLASKIGGKKMITAVNGLTVLILVITASLLIGAAFVSDEKRKKSIDDFTSIVFTFVISIAAICIILGALKKFMMQGIAAVAAIVVIAILVGVAMKQFAEATAMLPPSFKNTTVNPNGSKSETEMGNSLWTVLGAAGAIIVGLAGLAIGLGALQLGTMGFGAAALWAGIAALGAIVAIALMVGTAIKNFAEGYQIMVTVASSMTDPEATMDKLKNLMTNFTEFVNIFSDLGKDINPVRVITTAAAFGAVVNVVGGAASVIKDVADLIVPNYDKEGNITGYKEIRQQDFDKAIENTGKIITILADALIYIYENGVNSGFGKDIFRNTLKLSLITSGILNVVEIVGNSASIIKDLADFKYTYIDENGKEHKLFIDDTVLGKVKENIIRVVTCMSNALIEIYSNEDLAFKDNSILKTAKQVTNDVFSVISLSIDSMNRIIDMFSKEGSDKAGDKYQHMLDAIINPFTKNTLNVDQIKLFKQLSEIDFSKTSNLVNSLNRVDTAKTDKFIELSNKLIELNKNMGNLDSFISAFDEKITMTLGELAERIELASNTIKESDKSQEKRQKVIEDNRKKLKEMLSTPVIVKLSEGKPEPRIKSIFDLGDTNKRNIIETTKQQIQNNQNNAQDQITQLQQQQDIMSSKTLDNIDSTILSMAGTTTDIYVLLQQYLEKNN